ncbi:alpha/beta hydrolase [Kribbella sp. NPDC003505]|uniref:alpha/beta fold hydrolase n=1 Tax=Kribbella sp. NPDC003505 TaxID=3154448 RepID=UPI0033BA95E2
MTTASGRWAVSGRFPIRDVSLYAEIVGQGHPVVLMHGGPSADHWTLAPLRRCADQFTMILYDHRCNGRSVGVPVSSMTWDNLTADADALREKLGFEQWAVLGHSFGGHVALEYALRFPGKLSHLILLDTGGDAHWARQNAAEVMEKRGYSAEKAQLVRRWFTGDFERSEYYRILTSIGSAYYSRNPVLGVARDLADGGWRGKVRPEAHIFAGRHLLKDWTVMDRLGEIAVPTLVMSGRDDFVFPPECQEELAAGIPHARLRIIDHAGHSPHSEQPTETRRALRDFLSAT